MLHLIPAPLHRRLLQLAHAGRLAWWWLRRPEVRGCRVLAFDGAGSVLLIRHSYGSGRWMPPGGGVQRGEPAVAAALRELAEEVGCGLDGAVELDLLSERLGGATNRVSIVAGRARGEARPDGREIVEAAFFPLHSLPEHMPANLREGLPRWAARFAGGATAG